jgi:hypothetical protein
VKNFPSSILLPLFPPWRFEDSTKGKTQDWKQKDLPRPLFTFPFEFFGFNSSSSLQRTTAMVREKEGAKKRREEVHSRRGAIPGDFGEGGSTINVSDKRLRCRSAQASTEDPDLRGDTGTSSDDNVEDETFSGQYELRRHHEAGSDDDDSDEAEDEEDEE